MASNIRTSFVSANQPPFPHCWANNPSLPPFFKAEMAYDYPKTPLLPVNDRNQPSSPPPHFSLKTIATLKNFYVLLGPLLCAVICLCVTFDGPTTSRNMLAVTAWVFAWWLTEAVPMPITSIAPLFLFPLFGIASADGVARSYMDDVVTLLLGSFMLVLAVERYNVHRRLALNVSYLFEYIRKKWLLWS